MTRTIAPPGTGVNAPAPTAVRGGWRAALGRTPGRLRLAGVVAVLAALAVGLLGLQASLAQSAALSDAESDTSQLVGIQQVRNELVVADATATNAFLVGGLEPPEQRARYDEAVNAAAHGLAELAGSNASDARLLGQATADLTVYTGLVEQARANNRQGFPVGAAYLDQASTVLREDVLPALDSLVAANTARVGDSFDAVSVVLWLLVPCVLALAALVVVQVWLARRTHRRLNAGLWWASLLLLAATVAAAVVLGSASAQARSVRDGPYRSAVAVSQALSAANDARSMESFTLIKRGSGQAYEEQLVTQTGAAADQLRRAQGDGTELQGLLETWVSSHAQIRDLDDGGDWDGAVALAIDPAGAPATAFDAFSAAASTTVHDTAGRTKDALAGAGGAAVLVGWLVLLAGLLGAVLAWRGISRRLEEYR